ncbi:MAG: LysR family transcriptional regulator [Desulfovibrio sp.]|uniref:LysR family transcriptional regulator n=1 Tax=Desulfovibrio sp. TaxID=885 RepID=UPI00135E94F8|nr:LysR family transcriptional regulator [Desulfovibrio sp.]MTJ92324.1 LysR family transcriptional regulator [Desulfovibrio sp.]
MIRERSGDFLQWLRGFYFVAKTGNLSKAAEHMHRNVSTISYQIRSLEHELGIALFDRSKKKLILTQSGIKLLNWAVEIFILFEKMNLDIFSYKNNFRTNITIATNMAFSPFLTQSIAQFTSFNNSNIKIFECTCVQGLSALHDGRVDMVAAGGLTLPSEEKMKVLFTARRVLILPKDSPWGISAKPSLEELRRLPLIGFNVEDITLSSIASQERLNMLQLYEINSTISTNNYLVTYDLVRQGLGAAVVDEICLLDIRNKFLDDIVAIPVDHVLPCNDYGIIISDHRQNDVYINRLVSIIKEYAAQLTEELLLKL